MNIFDLLHDLSIIEGFTHNERKRALFCQNWLLKYGIEAIIDEKNNCIVKYNIDGLDKFPIYQAHIDTVFPKINQDYIDDGKYIHYPGVGDDTANVCLLLWFLKEAKEKNLDVSGLFVLNSCEEGLGNLEGTKHIFEQYKNNCLYMVSFDCTLDSIINHAVGSYRYELKINTKGGHSYSDFGNSNAIYEMSKIINEIYKIKPSAGTTYNVGLIEGGNSINSICSNASMKYEVRSNNQMELDKIDSLINDIIMKSPCDKEITILGKRPGMKDVPKEKLDLLVNKAIRSISRYTNKTPTICAGSTDCNIPLSMGIPAISFGGIYGYNAHTLQEYIDKESLLIGYKVLRDFIMEK